MAFFTTALRRKPLSDFCIFSVRLNGRKRSVDECRRLHSATSPAGPNISRLTIFRNNGPKGIPLAPENRIWKFSVEDDPASRRKLAWSSDDLNESSNEARFSGISFKFEKEKRSVLSSRVNTKVLLRIIRTGFCSAEVVR